MQIKEALTFDDILIEPDYSEILPKDTLTNTEIVKGISLSIPLISSAMDTVTEANMAIAMAINGGIGCIHKNFPTIEGQVKEIEQVKKHQSFMVKNPITLNENSTIADYKKTKEENSISTFPVVEKKSGTIIGIVTNRNFQKAEHNDRMKISKIMTQKENLVTAESSITKMQAEKILTRKEIEQLIIVDKNEKCIGLMTKKDIERDKHNPYSTKDKDGRLRVAAALGANQYENIEPLIQVGTDIIVVDSAHGQSKGVLDTIKYIRKNFENIKIIGGNVCTGRGAKALIEAGVDGVKVGIGPGSICTTRIIAGVGKPQFSAIREAYNICKRHKIPVIGDGGIKYSGDIVKAIVAGASSVMIGGLLAGTKEAPGEITLKDGKSFKQYRGMGSIEAMGKGSADRYFQEDQSKDKLVPEGVSGKVEIKGKVSEVLHQLNGGLKAGLGYTGRKDIKSLQGYKNISKVTSTSLKENHPHSLDSYDDTTNYRKK